MKTCRRKQFYRTMKAAESALRILRRHNAADAKNLHAYACRYCPGFHLGHPDSGERREFLSYLEFQFGGGNYLRTKPHL